MGEGEGRWEGLIVRYAQLVGSLLPRLTIPILEDLVDAFSHKVLVVKY